MNNNTVYTNRNNEPKAPDELLKTTALLYFKEALKNQEYEQCPALIKTAKRVGADQGDIKGVIAEYQNRGKIGGLNEAQKFGGRLGFLNEE